MGIRTDNHPTAEQLNAQVDSYYTATLPKIKASEVISEMEKRCAGGQQYVTFANEISDDEAALVEAEGFIITKNVVHGENRDGASDMYVGFQVALTEKATEKTMIISEAETNGIGSGGGGGGSAVLVDKTITANGVYNASDDSADGYSSVDVDVEPTLISKSITSNGVYNASDDSADGYSSVNVSVSGVRFTSIHTLHPGGDGASSAMWLFDAPDGNYVILNSNIPGDACITCKTPVKRLTITNVGIGSQIVFTTDSAFEGCFVNGVESTYSDNIFSVAGSGYASYVQVYDNSSYCFTPSNPVDDEEFYENFYFNMT